MHIATTFASTLWAVLESIALIVALPLWLSRKFKSLEESVAKLNYAIFNDGKTGIKNVVDEHIPKLVTDVAIIKNVLKVETP